MIVACVLAHCFVPAPTPVPPPKPVPVVREVDRERNRWDTLAECESHGEWDYGPHSGWGSGIYHGGLQFHPETWSAYRDAGMPSVAYEASREQQIAVAERVLAEQGWGAWPACTRELGWR